MRMILKKEVEFNTIVNDILKDEYFTNRVIKRYRTLNQFIYSILSNFISKKRKKYKNYVLVFVLFLGFFKTSSYLAS